jgi:hypothetical protein
MNAVNEIVARLRVRDFTGSPEAWGRDDGRRVYRLLEDKLFESEKADPNARIFVLDFSGMTRLDASFPQEAIVELLRKFRGRRYFVLTNFENDIIEENVAMGFEKRIEVGIVRDARGLRIIGLKPSQDLIDILALADARDSLTSKDVSEKMRISLSNASNKLKHLWEVGLLIRTEGVARSGGRENYYSAIKG